MLLTLFFIALIILLLTRGVALATWLYQNRTRHSSRWLRRRSRLAPRESIPVEDLPAKSHTEQLHEVIFQE